MEYEPYTSEGKKLRSASYHNPDRLLRHVSSMHRALTDTQVVVAVRVRPLNERETDAESTKCTELLGPNSIKVTADGQPPKTFHLDAVVHQEAPQEAIFHLTAKHILSKVFEGYNGTIFAYGQTGSGKTYSMIGGETSGEEGVIPRTCRQMFERIQTDTTNTYVVKGTMIEIYQEKLKDLLALEGFDLRAENNATSPGSIDSSRLPQNLLIRHDKSKGGKGIYVTGVRERILREPADILSMVTDGTSRRVVGSTNMNTSSSRSHVVVSLTISCQRADDVEGFTRTVSKLHLIDLAGSERAKATGATGARLKEGAAINKSLAALGNVVNSLTTKGRNHVPYRDSKLTRLLQDSLGGNSYTLMICCVSPAEMNAAETISSLRFAERTKKIQNKAQVNRDPKLARIAELTKENGALRAKVLELEKVVKELRREDIARKPSAREKATATISPAISFAGSHGGKKNGGDCCIIS